jgi:energy-converting hydrogenase Eha subunit H
MKKIVFIAVLTITSMLAVSCTTDSVETDNLKNVDNIKAIDVSENVIYADGPGDDQILIKPPKP